MLRALARAELRYSVCRNSEPKFTLFSPAPVGCVRVAGVRYTRHVFPSSLFRRPAFFHVILNISMIRSEHYVEYRYDHFADFFSSAPRVNEQFALHLSRPIEFSTA